MYPRDVSFVRASSLEPGAVCGLVLMDRLIIGLIGTTEDDYQHVTKHFVSIHGDDPATFGGGSFVNVDQLGGHGVFHLKSTCFVPEISARSLTGASSSNRWLGMRGEDIFLCVRGEPFVFMFDVHTGKDSNKPIRDMSAIRHWRIEATGTDGHPILVCEC